MSACATSHEGPSVPERVVHAPGPAPALAGKRCRGAVCRCRAPGDLAEIPPPPAGKKRIEIRLSAPGGTVVLDSPTVGHFERTGPEAACYYVDLPVSKIYHFHMHSHEATEGGGVAPKVHIGEYGPAGPYWYDILDVSCGVGSHGCDPILAREWGQGWVAHRRRGRLDPCGSIVVTGLRWSTSGGLAMQDGGLLRDFDTDFSLEVKKFATQFPPGASQCQIQP